MSPPVTSDHGARRTTVAALVTLVVTLTAVNIVRSAVVPDRFHLLLNLGVGVLALGVGLAAGLTVAELGASPDRLGAGLRLGLAAAGVVCAVVVVAALLPAFAGAFDDERVDVDAPEMLRRVLLVIPIGTVLVEEVVFRGILHGLLVRLLTTWRAVLVGAALFGLWHVYPVWRSTEGLTDQLLAALGTFVATAAAGVGFTWLRVRSDSLLAPVLAHVATNSVPFAVAWALTG